MNRLRSQLAELEAVASQKRAIIERVYEFAASLGDLYDQGDAFQKNAILQMIFPEGLEMEVESTSASPLVFRTARINSIFTLTAGNTANYAYLEVKEEPKPDGIGSVGDNPDAIQTDLKAEDVRLFQMTVSRLGMAM